jgi:hypothetical protein
LEKPPHGLTTVTPRSSLSASFFPRRRGRTLRRALSHRIREVKANGPFSSPGSETEKHSVKHRGEGLAAEKNVFGAQVTAAARQTDSMPASEKAAAPVPSGAVQNPSPSMGFPVRIRFSVRKPPLQQ